MIQEKQAVCCHFLIVLITALLMGCATSGSGIEPTYQSQESEEINQSLQRIYRGQDIDELAQSIALVTENYFEIKEGNSIYQYLQGRHPESGILFGLYFENWKLTSLIVEQDVTNFHSCRSSRSGEAHWLSVGFSPYRDWLMEKNDLEGGFPTPIENEHNLDEGEVQEKPQPDHAKINIKAEDVMHAIVHLPMLVGVIVLLPQMMPSMIERQKEEQAKEKQRRAEEKQLLEMIQSLQINMTEEELTSVMDKIGERSYGQLPNIYTYVIPGITDNYFHPSYSFGVEDGRVIWIESQSMLLSGLTPRSTTHKSDKQFDCGSLSGLIQRSPTRESNWINTTLEQFKNLSRKNPKEALVLLCKSADSGNKDARVVLGNIFQDDIHQWIEEGIVEPNNKRAYVWYALSGKWDQEYLKIWADRYLTPSDQSAAENILESWQPGNCEKDLGLD